MEIIIFVKINKIRVMEKFCQFKGHSYEKGIFISFENKNKQKLTN